MARRLGDPALTLRVIHAAMGALMDYAPASERAPLNELAAELATAQRDRPRALRSRIRLVFDRATLADLSGFEQALADLEALVGEVGPARDRMAPLLFHAMRACWEGRFADSAALEQEAFAIRARVGHDGAPFPSICRMTRALVREDPEALEQAADEVIATFV